ncbi:phenylalanine--tRNA ligase subunit beta [Candidatus Daviesbacteria bacterium RIFCSPLOWO2_02_FULL_36_7]|uniref:Phenylalanine--tRNA ligase beta subunit n=1 Tax=Candidatus Daviesbacteria bacterium RIFCSPLOWO2_02_FULL_36_7 TaxID=1797792 RepID=A0A1F5MHT0_9BACT|nr:MAG: phenylalanine--tRNA ligase subunit beta [Candidatus Daviesbacteria bacterium RIFCSPLOWO2_02_FULL_36_7]
MKVSIGWLKELVDLKVSVEELVKLLPLRTIGAKEVTDQYIELDMKGYNRADLLSLRRVAKEIAVITNSEVKFTQKTPDFSKLYSISVEVENIQLCPVYCVAKIENLKIGQSDKTWKQKLNDSGIRTVNNVADITNLVMVEYGQPMHAFDAGKVTGNIGVRVAKKDEKITTLDGKVRNLTPEDLLITDDNGPIGIAGVMGGKDSGISEGTTSILLEAAIFDPVSIRKTSQKHGLYSEASKRFQHELAKTNLLEALAAAIKMYEDLGGKLTALTLVGDTKDKTKVITLSQEKVNSLIGVNITPQHLEDSLTKLGFTLASHIGSGNVIWEVTVPYWRQDCNIEEDLIEEVARMYGYEKIPAKPLTDNIPNMAEKPLFRYIQTLKQASSETGLTEVQTYSYYSTAVLENLLLDKDKLIKLVNPISAESEYLRDNLWPNLLEAVAKNIRNGIKDVAIFEIGKAYLIKDGLPDEPHRLAIALSNGSNNPIAELYQICQTFHLGGGLDRTPGEFFHPARSAILEKDGEEVGFIAEIHPRIVNKFGIEQRVAVLEIEITTLL